MGGGSPNSQGPPLLHVPSMSLRNGSIIMGARLVLPVLCETNICAVALLISAKSDMHLDYSGLF